MAKSTRSSVRKRNNAALRAKVFDPVYDARTARLSAKLLEIAATPKPSTERRMDVDADEDEQESSGLKGGELHSGDGSSLSLGFLALVWRAERVER